MKQADFANMTTRELTAECKAARDAVMACVRAYNAKPTKKNLDAHAKAALRYNSAKMAYWTRTRRHFA